jgi:hypothetical protein
MDFPSPNFRTLLIVVILLHVFRNIALSLVIHFDCGGKVRNNLSTIKVYAKK